MKIAEDDGPSVRWQHAADTEYNTVAVEMGRYGNARVERAQRLCQRCDANSVDDVEHMIDCDAMDVERQKHHFLFARGQVALVDIFHPGPNRIGCFVHDCCKACKE